MSETAHTFLSDTPRTDEIEHPFRQKNDQTYTAMLEHARTLEREETALRTKLRSAEDDLTLWKQRCTELEQRLVPMPAGAELRCKLCGSEQTIKFQYASSGIAPTERP